METKPSSYRHSQSVILSIESIIVRPPERESERGAKSIALRVSPRLALLLSVIRVYYCVANVVKCRAGASIVSFSLSLYYTYMCAQLRGARCSTRSTICSVILCVCMCVCSDCFVRLYIYSDGLVFGF